MLVDSCFDLGLIAGSSVSHEPCRADMLDMEQLTYYVLIDERTQCYLNAHWQIKRLFYKLTINYLLTKY